MFYYCSERDHGTRTNIISASDVIVRQFYFFCEINRGFMVFFLRRRRRCCCWCFFLFYKWLPLNIFYVRLTLSSVIAKQKQKRFLLWFVIIIDYGQMCHVATFR